jgi:thiosulfate/3-mercaptopyruvate sulfurtransferase
MSGHTSRDTLLVETEWLAGRLGDPEIRVVDIRGIIRPPDAPKPWYLAQREAYRESHIPGAVFVYWTEDIVEPTAPIHMTVAGPRRFKALMERLGIGDQHLVVAYDDSGSLAPRLWWALNYYGHPRVKLLNGGWTRWVAEGRPVTPDVPAHPPVTFTPATQATWRAGSGEVRAAIGNPEVVLLDCRSPKEFGGEIGRGARKGRIPGAINVPSVSLLEGAHRTWKPETEIRGIFEAAGVTRDRRVITYCNAGVAASVGLFALKLLGHPAVSNFAGSWYEWEADPSNPVQSGT